MSYLKFFLAVFLLTGLCLRSQNDSIAARSQPDSTDKGRTMPFQLTFITPMGTNGMEAYRTTNRFSLNVLVGVARGVHGFEAGGLANVILKDVKGVQFAGLANVVLGEVKGAQYAAYFNYCGKNLKGVSAAALGNVALGELHGGQFSAGFNFNRKGGEGVQVAALANVILGNFKGAQVSALTNVATGSIQGGQIASFANIAAGDIKGAQVSGFLNVARKVKGMQLGIINIADSVDGVSIGFLNFVRKGKHQMEISADELFYASISHRMGTDLFHNIFSAGFKPGSRNNLWHFGYGAGSSFKLKNKLWGDLSATIHHVNTGGFYWGTSELLRLYCGVEYKIAKLVSVAAGPTLNFYLSDTLLSDYTTITNNIPPYQLFSHTSHEDFNTKAWIGGRIALRFL